MSLDFILFLACIAVSYCHGIFFIGGAGWYEHITAYQELDDPESLTGLDQRNRVCAGILAIFYAYVFLSLHGILP